MLFLYKTMCSESSHFFFFHFSHFFLFFNKIKIGFAILWFQEATKQNTYVAIWFCPYLYTNSIKIINFMIFF